MTREDLSVNGMIIFLSATVIAVVAIVLQRRRGGRQKYHNQPTRDP